MRLIKTHHFLRYLYNYEQIVIDVCDFFGLINSEFRILTSLFYIHKPMFTRTDIDEFMKKHYYKSQISASSITGSLISLEKKGYIIFARELYSGGRPFNEYTVNKEKITYFLSVMNNLVSMNESELKERKEVIFPIGKELSQKARSDAFEYLRTKKRKRREINF